MRVEPEVLERIQKVIEILKKERLGAYEKEYAQVLLESVIALVK